MKKKTIDPNGSSLKTLRTYYPLGGGGWGFYNVLSEMDKRGYDVQWHLFNSKNFGVPQNRDRVYIIGHLRGRGRRKVLFETSHSEKTIDTIIQGSQGNRVFNKDGISATLVANAGGLGAKTGLYGDRDEITSFIDLSKGHPRLTDTARCLKARYDAGVTNRQCDNSGVVKIKNATKQGYLIAKVGDGIDLSYPDSKLRRGRVQEDSTQTITCKGDKGVLTSDDGLPRIRKLTPRECWRLQGFTDEQFDKVRAINSDTQLYKQAGNAVTVNVVEFIGRAILNSEVIDDV